MIAFLPVVLMCCAFPSALNAQNPAAVALVDNGLRAEIELVEGTQTIEMCGLKPGETYGFQFRGMAADQCLGEVTIINGGFSQVGIGNPISFKAVQECVTLELDVACAKMMKSMFVWMSAYCMTCKRPTEETGLRYGVSPNGDADYLIREVFIGGGCFDVSGVSVIGNDAGLGEFDGGGPIGLDRGVIMASGNVTNSLGPNNNCCAGNSLGTAGDPDLNILSGQTTYDATGIEFDFRPTIPQISFNYVFASEEYPEYVCASFNDVFGFFISGPGIVGAFSNSSENIAWIPGTNIPVGINSVNPGVPGQFGNAANCTGKGSLSYSHFYVDNTGGQELQYDGWTTVFTATANVQICGTYHIKLVVADAGDAIFDSAVFLEANSFNAGGLADMSFESPTTGTNLVYEACNDGIITICKANQSDFNNDVVLNFTVDPSSTATPGVDYAPLPGSFFIPGGEMCIDYKLDVYFDLIQEGIETINLALELPCSCENPFITILISDTPPISAELDDFTVCADEGVDLNVLVSGGVPGFSYLWETGEVAPGITIYPNQSKAYTVTVTDECGQEVEALSNITVIPRPIATLVGDGVICAGDPTSFAEVTVTFEPAGSGPWNFSYMIDGEYKQFLNVTQNPFTFKVFQPGFINLLDVWNSECTGIVEGFGIIEEAKIQVFYDLTPVSCQGIDDGKILAIPVGIYTPYEFFWSNGWGWTDLLEPVGVGTYYVTITDALGCVKRDSVVISSPSDIQLIGNVTGDTECFSATGSVSLFVNGGQTPYTFLWSNGSTNQSPNNLPAGINTVTVTDSRGCESYASFNIVASDAPQAVATPLSAATCGLPLSGSVLLDVTGGLAPYQFLWSRNGSTEQNPNDLEGGEHFVTITDANGCRTIMSVSITFDTIAPIVIAGNADTITCGQDSLQLDGSGSILTGPGPFAFQWSTNSGVILSGGNTLTPNVGGPGIYTLQAIDLSNGCSSVSSVEIFPDLNAPIASVANPDTLTCSTTQIVLNGSGSSSGPGIQATWSTQGGNIVSGGTTLNPTVSAPGIYVLTLLNTANNCVTVQEVNVASNTTLPTVQIDPPLKLTCANPARTLDGSASSTGPQITYSWTTQGGNIVNGSTTPSPVINQPGTYTLLVTNISTGCADQRSVVVIEDKVSPLAVTGVSGLITCTDQEVELLGYGSSSGPEFTYLWTTLNGSITGDPNQINTTANGASTYLLTVRNTENGCQSFQTVQVLIDTMPPVAFAGPPGNINCGNPQTILDGTNSSNAPFFNYQWTTQGGNIVQGGTTLTPLVNQGGVYNLVVTDILNGCTAESFTIVSADFAVPTVIITDPPKLTCTVNQITLDASNSSFNSSVTFNWSTTGGNIVSGQNTVTPVVNAPGLYALSSLNTTNGCQGFGSVLVLEDRVLPVADAGKPGEIYCLGDSVQLDGSKSSTGTFYTYDWYQALGGPAYFLNRQAPYTQEAGNYHLVVTDTRNGCTATDLVVIGADFLSSADVQLSDPICYDDPGTLEIYNVQGGLYPYQYSVNGGQSFQYNPRFRNLSSGQYKIVVRDAKGCEIRDDYEIPEVNELLIHVEPEITIKLGDQIRLEAQLNFDPGKVRSILWYPGYGLDRVDSLVVLADPFITTPYFITVVDTFGCEGKTQFKIIVKDPDIFVPNAFSPYNNDGNNDRLMIFAGDFGIESIEIFEVFTRWGERVYRAENFQPNDEKFGWDGLHQGQTMNPAVFVYYAKVRLIDGRVITVKGDVNLMN
jgi:hypothetical protein